MRLLLPAPGHVLVALIAAGAFAYAARRVRALSLSGAVAATVVGTLLFGFGGGPGAAVLLVFFGTSTALSRFGKRRKSALSFEKGGERDAVQVFANGGVAAVCAAFLPLFSYSPWLIAALLAALAEANADTWATEVGSLAAAPPRLITTLRPAPTGASGAISLPGTLAALGGAMLIAALAPLWHTTGQVPVAVLAAGFVGALFDSLLGATVQAQYRCRVCARLTEQRTHCEQPTTLARGLPWLNNDVVNTAATVFAALVAGVLLAPRH